MTSALDIVNAALKKVGIVGVGQTASAEDANDAFDDLNDMLALWARKRWLVWHLVDYAFASTGAQSYTVGPGGNFNVPSRPDRLEAAYFRQTINSQPNQVDYPLAIIEARETYNRIALKSLASFPEYIFYDSAYPLGSVFPWPIPQAGIYELHITLKEQLGQLASLAQVVVLPPEYFAAVKFNLAVRLRVAYQLPVDPGLVALAKDALNTIRGANTQIALLRMPSDLTRPGRYNIFSDQVR